MKIKVPIPIQKMKLQINSIDYDDQIVLLDEIENAQNKFKAIDTGYDDSPNRKLYIHIRSAMDESIDKGKYNKIFTKE